MTKVSLRHANHTLPQRVEPFYDGIEVAVDGVISIDASDTVRLQAAYFRGYMFTLDGRRLYGFTELDEYVSSVNAKSEDGHESKSPNRRRQSTT